MKNINKISLVAVFVVLGVVIWGVGGLKNSGLSGKSQSAAAISANLLSANGFAIMANTYTNTTAGTTITGDVGYTTPPAATPTISGATHVADGAYTTAGIDQGSAWSALASQACTFTFAPGAIDLSTDTTHGTTTGVYTPGVYCSTGAMNVGGPLSLSGSGTFIFRPDGAFNSTVGSIVSLAGGASACDVFWTPTAATTLGADSTFIGTVIDAAGITVGNAVTWTGRALASGGTVTTANDTITVPSCSVVPPVVPATLATLHIIKQVVNNNGGTAVASAFNLHVKLSGTDVSGSPALGTVTPGTPYTLSAGTYVVSEDVNNSYLRSFSGACDAGGSVTLSAGADVTCTVTNDDIAGAVVALPATLNVTKTVINDNGGVRTAASFPLFVNGTPVVSGVTNTFAAPATYTVTETGDSNYTRTFSGDCDVNGNVTLASGNNKTCTITNNDIAAGVVTPPAVAPTLPTTGYPPQE
jgi:hypothetical protein